VAGSLDGRAWRVRRLEVQTRKRGRSPAPSRTQEEAWAIDAEIARLDRQMKALGIDPYREPGRIHETNFAGHPMLSLDEHIAMLEAEIAREEQGHGEP
jgi:5'-3' exonuclease